MSKKHQNKKDAEWGSVMAMLGDGLYQVEMDSGKEVICYLAGKMRVRNISVYVGDKVEVVLDPAGGKTTNRIVWRK